MGYTYGSNDPTGLAITDTATVTAIVIALRYNTSITVNYGGFTFKVGSFSGNELSTTGYTCNCNYGYVLRPCHGGINWGGYTGLTCGAALQTMSLYFA